MSSDNRHIPRVIELGKWRGRDPITSERRQRVRLSPPQALYYAEHADAIMRDFDREQYGAVLREIERHLVEWESQQTPEQREWVAQMRRRDYCSSREGVKRILHALGR
jgi:hypothetical protein